MNMKFAQKFSADSAEAGFDAMRQSSRLSQVSERYRLSRLGAIFVFGLVAAGAWAAQPPDPTNSDSYDNTAGGTHALLNLVTGYSGETAFGAYALQANTTGNGNTAFGSLVLIDNTTGGGNTAVGSAALYSNTTGSNNTAVGSGAMQTVYSGSGNIAIGAVSGDVGAGNNNIDIGNEGVSGESSIIRLGTSGTQTAAYIAGISGVTVTGGADVVINSSGQLGTVVSSAQYKKDIQPMGDDSAKLALLRPVTFHYKADPSQQKQYGLIAEEVAQVYPDLAVRDAQGKVQSVQYHQLIPMLLNEVQKQQRETRDLKAENASLRKALRAEKTLVEARLTRLEQQQAAHPAVVASR